MSRSDQDATSAAESFDLRCGALADTLGAAVIILGGGIPAGSVTVVAFAAHLVKPASYGDLTRILGRERRGD